MEKLNIYKDAEFLGEMDYEENLTVKDICRKYEIPCFDVISARFNNIFLTSSIVPAAGKMQLVTIHSSTGNSIRQNTTVFIMLKAFYNCFNGQYKIVVEHSVGDGVYCEVFGNKVFSSEELDILKAEMERIITAGLTISKAVYTYQEAYRIFTECDRKDVLPLLNREENVIYECGKFNELIFAQLANTTDSIKNFKLKYHSPGFIVRYPSLGRNELSEDYHIPQKLFTAHQEHDKWLGIINLHVVKSLNKAIDNCTIQEKIQIEEALHERKLVKISDEIVANRQLRLILIAGPSSSGKTTFSKRLAIQLIVNGIRPKQISLDDYFLPHDRTPRKKNGDYDFENIEAIDLERLNNDLSDLLEGKTVALPKYEFTNGTSHPSGRTITLKPNDLLVIEGIHGLNDILTQSIPFQQKTKIYVSALNSLNIDEHNRISTTDSRRIRRIVRDHQFRGSTAELTLKRWDDIREGELKYIFPYQENADYMFNSILTYELSVLRQFARPLLETIDISSPVFPEAARLLLILDLIRSIPLEFVPANSIVREFIGGSAFKY
ncbi:MAG: nucleoside kinase [Candidatus Cloacimonetes bacterium]|nr:nucleoside kinase [Candidatus Cloacimonadota bacterium]